VLPATHGLKPTLGAVGVGGAKGGEWLHRPAFGTHRGDPPALRLPACLTQKPEYLAFDGGGSAAKKTQTVRRRQSDSAIHFLAQIRALASNASAATAPAKI